MILPAKHLPADRALAAIGAEILFELNEDRTVSELWERVRSRRLVLSSPLSFDWFVLALSMLFGLKAIDYVSNVVTKRADV